MRKLGAISLAVLVQLCAPVLAADGLPENGAAKLSAYQVCHPLAAVDMGALGASSSIECSGIVRSEDKALDNLAIHCLEDTDARPQAYHYSGICTQTDGDGDKLYMTYEGSKEGQVKWIGGTGKYADVSGTGSLGVQVAPGGAPTQFAYTLSYEMNWTRKAK